jgi:hypothetical protein
MIISDTKLMEHGRKSYRYLKRSAFRQLSQGTKKVGTVSISSILGQCGSGCRSRVLMPNNLKKFTVEIGKKKKYFFPKFTYPRPP